MLYSKFILKWGIKQITWFNRSPAFRERRGPRNDNYKNKKTTVLLSSRRDKNQAAWFLERLAGKELFIFDQK